MSLLSIAGASPSDDGFELKSVRLDDGSLAYLSRTPTIAGNRRNWTFSCWFKLGAATAAGGEDYIFTAGSGNSGYTDFLRVYQSKLKFACVTSGGVLGYKTTTAVLRDTAAWYHVVATYDSPNATAGDRMRLYLNGERVTAFSESGDVSQNFESYFFNTAVQQFVGAYSYSQSNQTWDGYLAEVYFVDGSSLDGSSFGETNEDTNQWQPKNPTDIKPTLTWGRNGFYLPFSNDALNNSFVDDSGGYVVPSGVTEVEVLVVGGGGAGSGGGNGGGGGGAGGLVYIPNYTVTPGERISVTVGAGGAAQAAGTSGNDGANSVFKNITAIGGGGGGESAAGRNGGSGGGGWQTGNTAGGSSTQTTTNAGYTSTGWGTAGGQGGNGAPYQGGGGGGAGAAGSPGAGTSGGNGTGGNGKAYTIADGSTSVTYAGGGGGGLIDNWPGGAQGGAGGSGGGGKGGYGNHSPQTFVEPVAGTANTGGGGGGGRNDGGGAAGGSGVVIVYDGTTRTTFTATDAPHTVTETGDMENVRIKRQNLEVKEDATGGAHFIGPKFGTGCVTMDGSGEYLSAAYSTDWNFGTGDFTIEWWMNSKSLPASGSAVPNNHSPIIGYAYYGNPTGGRWNGWGFGIREKTAGNQYLMALGQFAVNTGVYATPDDEILIPTGSWHHYAFVRQGAVGKVYVDGVLGSTWTTTSGAIDASDAGTARNLRIGQFNYDDAYFGDLKAYMDEVRISDTARYTANFTPDTEAFTDDANTKLLIHCDGAMGSTSFVNSGIASTFTPTENLTCQVLVVGGGGGTATRGNGNGGGGAGGLVYVPSYAVTADTNYNITVGAGAAATASNVTSTSGADSVFDSAGASQILTGVGGGGGGASTVGMDGKNGGSGGGGANTQYGGGDLGDSNQPADFGSYSGVGFGNNGGSGTSGWAMTAGGGGGAGAVGANAVSTTVGGAGGAGKDYSSVFGTGVGASGWFAGGGGGGGHGTAGAGGTGGGGAGGNYPAAGTPGTANTGGGAGGSSADAYPGAAGGSGVVIVRYAGNVTKATGGTISTVNVGGSDYKIHTFTSVNTITANGDARVIAPKFGKGCYRNNGSDNGLAVPRYKEPWAEFDQDDFTVCAWVCLDDISTDNQQFFTHRWGVNSGDWVFWWSASNGLTWSGSNDTLNQGNTTGWASNTWVHIAACRTGMTNRLFVNGTIVATNITATENYDATAKVYLMSYGTSSGDTSSGAATGFMDEARIIQGKALYAGNFTPATTAYSSDANTKLLLHCDGSDGGTTFTDSSGSAHTMTAVGNTHTDTTIKKIGTASGQFDGTGDFISTPNSADFNFGTGDFTFEGWFYTTATTDQILFSQYQDASNRWYMRLDNRTAQQGIGFYNHNGSIDIEASDKTWPGVNQWVHMAFVRYDGVISIYINGESIGLKTNSGGNGSFANNTGTLRIGDYNGGNNYSGYMDEIRISNSARYTASFTPATQPFNDDRDTPFLMHMDGGIDIDEATGFATGAGEGKYAYNGAVNAIFYDTTTPNLPLATNKSMVNFPGNGYLSVANSADFEFGTGDFTIETWMYLTKDQDNRSLFGTDATGSNSGAQIEFVSADEHIATYDYSLESNWNEVTKSNKPLPLGKWIHFAYVRESLSFYMYIDGVRQSSTGFTSTNAVGHSSGPYWGYHRTASTRYLDDVYLDQMRISNNARYSVNFTPPTTPFTADANTKLLIQSDWSEGGLGADHSGNYNYYTPNNLTADDMMPDSPMNNFATFNPLAGSSTNTYSEGNLEGTGTSGQWKHSPGTIPASSGKWYWEVLVGSGTFSNGITDTDAHADSFANDATSNGYYYLGSGSKRVLGTETGGFGATYGTGDIIGVALDLDSGTQTITFYKNNSSQGALTITRSTTWVPGCLSADTIDSFSINFGQDSSFAGNKTAQGNQDGNNKGDFYYAVPSGYLALCTDNLPDPLITLPTDYFNAVTYAGTGASQTIAVGFQPDFVWAKSRNAAVNNVLYDSVRGTGRLESNTNIAEGSRDGFVGFSSNGFDVDGDGGGGGINYPSGRTYVSWNWKAGTSFDPATAGTVASGGSGSANATAGFSIVKYPGSASDVTVGHGLSQAPELILIKNIDAAVSWPVYVGPLGNAKRLELNDPYYEQATGHWVNTSPTASVFTLDGGVQGINNAGDDFIAYCFHSVEGYSKVGSYIAGGPDGDANFLYCGFRPSYVLFKETSATNPWAIIDNKTNPYNLADQILRANVNDATYSHSSGVDFVSNGIKLINVNGMWADAGAAYFYYAIAESPFKTSNAR